MSLVINGKKYNIVGLNGKEYFRGYFNGRLVLFSPDNTPYLMAAPRVRLAADGAWPLSWQNTPQLAADTLSGQTVGQNPFRFSFLVNAAAIGTGTRRMADLPGIMRVKSEAGTLMFWFYWENKPVWKSVPASCLASGWNTVNLTGDGSKIKLKVNGRACTLLDAGLHYEAFHFTNHGLKQDGALLTGTGESSAYAACPLGVYNWSSVNEWHIKTKYTHKAAAADYPSIFGPYSSSSRDKPELEINKANADQLYVNLNTSSSGSSASAYYLDVHLVSGTTYWFDLYFDGSKYGLKVSTDGTNYTDYTVLASSAKLYTPSTYRPLCFLNSRIADGTRFNTGSIDMRETHIILGGEEVDRTVIYPNQYPPVTTGQLSIQNDWRSMKEVRAEII